MPDKHERYNRFMKYLAPGYGEKGQLDDRWSGYRTNCNGCNDEQLRDEMKLKGGLVLCQKCLKEMSETR